MVFCKPLFANEALMWILNYLCAFYWTANQLISLLLTLYSYRVCTLFGIPETKILHFSHRMKLWTWHFSWRSWICLWALFCPGKWSFKNIQEAPCSGNFCAGMIHGRFRRHPNPATKNDLLIISNTWNHTRKHFSLLVVWGNANVLKINFRTFWWC